MIAASVTHYVSWIGLVVLLVLVLLVGIAIGFGIGLERAARHVSRARRDS